MLRMLYHLQSIASELLVHSQASQRCFTTSKYAQPCRTLASRSLLMVMPAVASAQVPGYRHRRVAATFG